MNAHDVLSTQLLKFPLYCDAICLDKIRLHCEYAKQITTLGLLKGTATFASWELNTNCENKLIVSVSEIMVVYVYYIGGCILYV